MYCQQLGKNLFIYLVSKIENFKIYKIKLKNKTKVIIHTQNNKIIFCKTKSKKYTRHLVAWIIFNKKIQIQYLNIILNEEQLDLIKNKCTEEFLLYQALQNSNINLIKKINLQNIHNVDDIILSCTNCSYNVLRLMLKTKNYLKERILIRAIYDKNVELVKKLISKIKNLDKYLNLSNYLEYKEIFNIILKAKIKVSRLNKK